MKVIVHMHELALVTHLSMGYTVTEAADKMNKNHRTIEGHLLALCKRFECRNKTHLVAYFMRKGWVK